MPRQPQPRPVSVPLVPANYTFVVYAPFGTDAQLSSYQGAATVAGHPLFKALASIAKQGWANVCAYIDRVGDNTWYLQGAAGAPALLRQSAGKQAMDDPHALADLLQRARQAFPNTMLVLALEGHGAGYLPQLDLTRLTMAAATDGGELGPLRWRDTADGGSVVQGGDGARPLGMGSPLLPVGSPFVATNHRPLSTAALRLALQAGLGGSKLAALHLNNCFNLSLELLDTVQPHARYATSYANYNFFTGGLRYPEVFRPAGGAAPDAATLARRFAEHNRGVLPAADHPTTGAAVTLARLPAVTQAFAALAASLSAALTANPFDSPLRRPVVEAIRQALRVARHYDTWDWTRLDAHDDLVDVLSLARALQNFSADRGAVAAAATALATALKPLPLYRYGTAGWPWMIAPADTTPPDPARPGVLWNFEDPQLLLNVLCPDPVLEGWWDWRSAFYLQATPTPYQPVLCEFMRKTGWRQFILDYHEHLSGVVTEYRFRPARIPEYPLCPRPLTPSQPGQPGQP